MEFSVIFYTVSIYLLDKLNQWTFKVDRIDWSFKTKYILYRTSPLSLFFTLAFLIFYYFLMIPYIFLPILYYLGSIDIWAIIKPQYCLSIPEPMTLSATGFWNNYPNIPPASGVNSTVPVPVAPQPVPVAPQPVPVAPQPAPGWGAGWGAGWWGPVAPQPAPVAPQPAPVAPQPAPVAPQPAPVATHPEPVTPLDVMSRALNPTFSASSPPWVQSKFHYKTAGGSVKPYYWGQCHNRELTLILYDRDVEKTQSSSNPMHFPDPTGYYVIVGHTHCQYNPTKDVGKELFTYRSGGRQKFFSTGLTTPPRCPVLITNHR